MAALHSVVLAMVLTAVRAGCPGGGIPQHSRCWYLSDQGVSCQETCQRKGVGYSHHVAGDADPVVPKLLGREPATRQFAWARTECYVPGSDRYHTSKANADSNSEDTGEPGAWKHEVCRLACPCAEGPKVEAPPVDPAAPYPACMEQNSVMRHAGAHAIFVDLSSFGSAGCWQNDCKHTDKFNADDVGICGRTCAQVEECTHWSYGDQEDAKKCFLRKSDGGREVVEGWRSGAKSCAPQALPDAFQAYIAARLLEPCDAGKSDACPDMARAITTWRFAIKHLKRATEGRVDPNTINFINQVSDDTDAFAAQMSEDNFPVVVGNNRQVFLALMSWMAAQPTVTTDANDASLPNPLRGYLCGAASCYEKIA